MIDFAFKEYHMLVNARLYHVALPSRTNLSQASSLYRSTDDVSVMHLVLSELLATMLSQLVFFSCNFHKLIAVNRNDMPTLFFS